MHRIRSYTVDTDGNASTTEDMEIYATVIGLVDSSELGPVRITTNDVYDGNPQTVKYNDTVWLYWNNNNTITYIDFENAIEGYVVKNAEGKYEIPSEDLFCYTLEEGADAASTFTISLQPDGYVYMLWNQLETFDDKNANIDKDDLYGQESTSAFVNKRSIYMRVYDPQYEQKEIIDEENGAETIYSGKWGSAVRIDEPISGDTYYNEQTFSSRNTENAVAAFRRYKMVDNGSGGTKEDANSDLVIHNYRLVSTLDIQDGDVYVSPEHPSIGEDALLYITVKNVGVLPSDSVSFNATMTDDKGNKTELGTNTFNAHITTDGTLEGTIPFNMPADTEYLKFHITAWEDNITENAVEYDYTVTSGAELEMLNPEIQRVDNESAYISGVVLNRGNKPTGDMTYKVAVIDNAMANTMNGTDNKYQEIFSTTVQSIAPNETLELNNLVDISKVWGDSNKAQLEVSLETQDRTLYTDEINLSKFSTEDIVISDIVINNDDTAPISVNEGDCAYPKVKIAPNGADSNYSLEYSSANSEIAEVDPSSGKVIGIKPGKTSLIVKAIKNNYSYFVDKDGIMYNPDGSVVKFDEKGNAINLFEGESGYVAMTKEIEINVNSLGIKELPTEVTTDYIIETTTERTTEVTTNRNDDSTGSSASAKGKSSSKATSASAEKNENADTSITDDSKELVENSSPFEDIKGLWAEEFINYLYNLGIISGRSENIFAPDEKLTRAELVTILAKQNGVETEQYANEATNFADVSKDSWYYNSVVWAEKNGIVFGTSKDKFSPNEYVSREDTATIMFRLFKEQNDNLDTTPYGFKDEAEISNYALDAVNALANANIIKGYADGEFKPKNNITRAEISALFYQLIIGGEKNE